MTQPSLTPESTSAVILRLLRNGGYVLVIGGGTDELPDKYRNHPQIMLWDDNRQGFNGKKVPTNTRAILFNRWISHSSAAQMRNAAERLKIPIFPMLRTREIKEMLSDVVNEPPIPTSVTEEIELPPVPVKVPMPPAQLEEEPAVHVGPLRRPKKKEIDTILAKELRDDETPAQGTQRLLPVISQKYGIEQTKGSLEQAIRTYRIRVQNGTAGVVAPPAKRGSRIAAETSGPSLTTKREVKLSTFADDFVEADKMLRDARVALDLLIEFMPKLRKEVESLRKKQQKIREFLD